MEPKDQHTDPKQETEAPPQPRKPYQTPRVVELGSVEDLTKGALGFPGDDMVTGTAT